MKYKENDIVVFKKMVVSNGNKVKEFRLKSIQVAKIKKILTANKPYDYYVYCLNGEAYFLRECDIDHFADENEIFLYNIENK